jgi:hypothetical protein
MKRDEIVNRNISLTFDFLKYITEHPEMIEQIPDGCELEFIDKGFPLADDWKNKEGGNRTILKVGYVFDIGS